MTRGITAAITIAILTMLTLVSVINAHTPSASLTCEGGLRVHLEKYNGRLDNIVTVTLDGTFLTQEEFRGVWDLVGYGHLDPFVSHTANVDVQAWDDPHGTKGWTKSYDLSLEPCQESPTPSPTPEVTPSPTPAPSKRPDPTPAPPGTSRPTLPPTDTD